MSKVSNSLKMLSVLSARSVVSKEELANILETNIRNISEYKKELEEAGFEIDVLVGIYGGYRLNREKTLPAIPFTETEKNVLLQASDYINKRYDFLEKKEFELALGKVISSINVSSSIEDTLIIDRFPLAMSPQEIKERYNVLNDAIITKKKVSIDYLSSKNTIKTHIIHPYKLYMYNLAWYILAFNESIHDVGYFKINRIDKIKKLNGNFLVLKTFEVSNYLDKFGMRQNGEYIDISLELKKPYAALVRERIYGKNQSLEFIDDETTILNCSMQNMDNIVSFVLGFGTKAKVLKPDFLKERIKNELEKMLKNF